MNFKLHSRLEQDCIFICDLQLCRVLLMNESRYPWFILVPMVENLRELMELSELESKLYWQESTLLQSFLKSPLGAEKLNVAALGNMVPQLHIHHIGRFKNDAAWPAPVWGRFPPEMYTEVSINEIKNKLLRYIGEQTS